MPIPISATHPSGAGLQAAQNESLPTQGPFARLLNTNGKSDNEIVNGVTTTRGVATADQGVGDQAPGPRDNEAGGATITAIAAIAAIATSSLTFWYCDIDGKPLAHRPPVVRDMTVSLPQGATCLLIGPNGAGKTTLLKVLAGKHMVPPSSVSVLGEPPFHATHLTTSGALSYIGGNWDRDVAFAGYNVPLAGDISAGQMLNSMPGTDPERLKRLIDVLDIDVHWRMHVVSDGQRRRVQIAMGLLKPFQVLLLDEITVDLDVLGRSELFKFLKEECAERKATIIYATHIFDGLESWPSHVMYVSGGELLTFERAEDLPELQQGKLLELVERWLRQDQLERRNGAKEKLVFEYSKDSSNASTMEAASWNNGWTAGRLTSSMKLSSNAVMRM